MTYLDHAATTQMTESAKAAAIQSWGSFGNPSSPHDFGLVAERIVKQARQTIADALGARPAEIFFTSGGTESNNWAIFGGFAARRRIGAQIITTPAEHPSVTAPIEILEGQNGAAIRYVRMVGGQLDMDGLADALKMPTALVSVHHVNSETGDMQDIFAIGRMIKQTSPQTLFHVDACQSFCKLPIDIADVDMLSISGHKVGGGKGVGGLFIKSGVFINPLIHGGGQEAGLRSGTENVPQIAAFAAAALEINGNKSANLEHVVCLEAEFLEEINGLSGFETNKGRNASPYIVNISLEGLRPEVAVNSLSARGIYISTGAACSARKADASSKTLQGLGYSESGAKSALRISFSASNTIEEARICAKAICETVTLLKNTKGVRR